MESPGNRKSPPESEMAEWNIVDVSCSSLAGRCFRGVHERLIKPVLVCGTVTKRARGALLWALPVLPLEQNFFSTVRGGFIPLPLTGLSLVLPLSPFLWELASLDPMFKCDMFVVASRQERINQPLWGFPEGFSSSVMKAHLCSSLS